MDMAFASFKNREFSIIEASECRKSAVCIPLLPTENGYDMLFEIRSSRLAAQPGDICFPGGMVENGETPEEAAGRELREELLILEDQYEMGPMIDILHTGNLMIYPFLVFLKDYQGTFCKDETAEVLRVPCSFFVDHEPELHQIRLKVDLPEDFPFDRIQGGRAYRWRDRKENMYFYPEIDGKNIWGITAKIIRHFIGLCKAQGVCV